MVSVEREDLGQRPPSVTAAIDTQAQGFMRAPDDLAASFAFESAVDELSYELGEDPLELRLRGGGRRSGIAGTASPCPLAASLRRGAALFNWSRRSREPGSMRDAEGSWIGLGIAAGTYKIASEPLLARVRLRADGSIEASIGGQEIDQGIRVAIALVLAERLGIDLNRIQITVGETTAPPQQLTAEAGGTPTAAAVIHAAAEKIRTELVHLARGADTGPLSGSAMEGVTLVDGHLVLTDGRRDGISAILRRAGRSYVDGEIRLVAAGRGQDAPLGAYPDSASPQGPTYPDPVALSFAAYFAEVHINPAARRIRVARALGVFDCAHLVSTDIARTQAFSGLVWGVGAALSESSKAGAGFPGLAPAETAEDQAPVNAAIQNLLVEFINEPDPKLTAIGAKGLGEAASVGTAAAIANAIYHATGKRRRALPIRAADLFETG